MRIFLTAAACGLALAAGIAHAYDSDLDTGFSDGVLRGFSKPYFDVGAYPSEYAAGLFHDAGGGYLLVGEVCTSANCATFDIGIVRLLHNGRFDTGFGTNGYVRTAQTLLDHITAVARDAQGRFVVVGPTAAGATADTDFGVVRLRADGHIDTSFAVVPPPLGTGVGGFTNIDFGLGGSNDDEAADVAVLADGSIVVVGSVTTASGYDVGLAKLTGTGQPDGNFGSAGRARFGFGSNTSPLNSWGASIVVDASGNLLVAGTAQPVSGGNSQFAVARYRSSGTGFDPSFCLGTSCAGGNPGRKLVAATKDPTRAYGNLAPRIAVDPLGAIYLGGTVNGYTPGSSNRDTDIYLMGFDASGNDLPGFAAQSFQGISGGYLFDLAVDPTPPSASTIGGHGYRLVYAGKTLDGTGGSRALIGRFLTGNRPTPDYFFAPGFRSYATLTTPHYPTETHLEGWFSKILFEGPRIVLGGSTYYCCSNIALTNFDFLAARLVDDEIFGDGFELIAK